MTSAGWYPDPAGSPGAFRYWDGAAWGPQTTTNPGDPLPGGWRHEPPTVQASQPPPAGTPGPFQQPTAGPPQGQPQQTPQQPQGWADPSGQPGYGGYGGGYGGYSGYGGGSPGGPGGPSSSGGGRKALWVVAAVLGLVLVAVGSFLAVRGLSGDDDPQADPSRDPSTSDTGGSTGSTLDPENPTDAQCDGGNPFKREPSQDDGRMQSGGLSIPLRTGFDVDGTEAAFTFADRVVAVGQNVDPQWLAVYALGELPRANGYETLEQSALTVLTCMKTNDKFYTNITSDEQLSSEEVDVDGSPGWVVTDEIRVDQPGLTVDGDIAQVVVVDLDDDARFGLFVSVVPIDDQARIADQQQALEDLEVD